MKTKKIILSALLVGVGLATMPKINVSAVESKKVISNVDVKSVNPDIQYEGTFHVHDSSLDYYSSKYYNSNATIGLYFTVPKSANYSIIDSATNSAFEDRWSGLQKQMYHVDSNTGKLTLVGEKPYNLKAASANHLYTGDPLKVTLKAGEKYLLVYNNDGHKIPLKQLNIRTQFERIS